MTEAAGNSDHGAALVTGAARRIGRAIAHDLAAAGWPVVVHHFESEDEAQSLVAEIEAAGGRACALAADLADTRAVQDLMAAAWAALGPITCLINNASLFEYDSIRTVTPESWDAHMAINLRAPMLLARDFAQMLDERAPGRPGNIINLLDQRVWKLTPQFLSYTVSKAGLWTLTRTLAQALAPDIRVNAIGPGPTLKSRRQSEAHFEAQVKNLPLARATSPEEICRAVRFILETPSLTGQMLALDGGQHLAWQTPDVIDIRE